METRVCKVCQQELPFLENFTSGAKGKTYYHHICKLCRNEKARNIYNETKHIKPKKKKKKKETKKKNSRLHKRINTREEVYNQLRNKGVTHTSPYFDNKITKMTAIKPCGHPIKARAMELLKYTGCKVCFFETKARDAEIKVINHIRKFGGKEVGPYKGALEEYKYLCEFNHPCSSLPGVILNKKDGLVCNECWGNTFEHGKSRFLEFLDQSTFRFDDGEDYRGSEETHKFICEKDHNFTTSPYRLMRGLSGCSFCSGKNTEAARLRFEKAMLEKGLRLEEGQEWGGSEVKLWILCSENHRFKTAPCLIYGRESGGCPDCQEEGGGYKPNQGGFFYVTEWDNSEYMHSFLKYGITNKSAQARVVYQSAGTDYKAKILVEEFFENGYIPVEIEREIKKSMVTGVISKDIFRCGGYTETVYNTEANMNKILDIVNKYKPKQ